MTMPGVTTRQIVPEKDKKAFLHWFSQTYGEAELNQRYRGAFNFWEGIDASDPFYQQWKTTVATASAQPTGGQPTAAAQPTQPAKAFDPANPDWSMFKDLSPTDAINLYSFVQSQKLQEQQAQANRERAEQEHFRWANELALKYQKDYRDLERKEKLGQQQSLTESNARNMWSAGEGNLSPAFQASMRSPFQVQGITASKGPTAEAAMAQRLQPLYREAMVNQFQDPRDWIERYKADQIGRWTPQTATAYSVATGQNWMLPKAPEALSGFGTGEVTGRHLTGGPTTTAYNPQLGDYETKRASFITPSAQQLNRTSASDLQTLAGYVDWQGTRKWADIMAEAQAVLPRTPRVAKSWKPTRTARV